METQLEKVNPTPLMLWSGQIKYYPLTTIQEAIQCNSHNLAWHKKDKGEQIAVASVIILVDAAVKFFSLGKTMNSAQLAETSRLIVQEFWMLKIEDLRVFFERLKTGLYGEMYDRIDGQVIMAKLRLYCEERAEISESNSLEAHKEAIAEEREEQYLISIGKNWLRSCGDDFEEISEKEMATAYTYGVAVKLKDWLNREHYSELPSMVKIVNINKAGSFFDYLEKNAPKLLPEGEKFRRATEGYYAAKEKILADESLSEFEKCNAVRKLAGLEPLTENEFKEHLKFAN